MAAEHRTSHHKPRFDALKKRISDISSQGLVQYVKFTQNYEIEQEATRYILSLNISWKSIELSYAQLLSSSSSVKGTGPNIKNNSTLKSPA